MANTNMINNKRIKYKLDEFTLILCRQSLVFVDKENRFTVNL